MINDQDGGQKKGDDRSTVKLKFEHDADGTDLDYYLNRVPEFGLWRPNIKEAAKLVAVDMWFSGEIEGVNEPEDFDGDYDAPWLITALADTIATFEAKLSAAVDNGSLEASRGA